MRVTRLARSYCAAVMLNLALVGELPLRPSRPVVGFEREFAPHEDRLDPRELVGGAVITVPIDLSGMSRSGYDLN